MTTVGPAATSSPGTATRRQRGARGTSPEWPGTLRLLARPAAYYLASRALVLAVLLAAALVVPGLHPMATLGSLFDGRWYAMIAEHGYPHRLFQEGTGSRWAFFPALPLVLRATATLTGLPIADAAVADAFVFGLASALAIWLAVRELLGPLLADRAVLLYVFFPTAYVLSMAYTEGLFIAAAAFCLLALARRAWLLAGLCACAAGFTRSAGVVVVLAVLVTALPVAWRDRSARAALGAAVAPLGLLAFMAYGWAIVGTPVAFLSAERFWYGQHFVWFATPVVAALRAVRHGPFGPDFVSDALAGCALALGFLGVWWMDRMGAEAGGDEHGAAAAGVLVPAGGASARAGTVRVAIPAAWWVYTVGTLLVAYSAYFSASIPRYTMAAFPLFAAMAWRFRRHRLWPVVAGMAVVQGALFLDVLRALHPVVNPLVP